MDISYRNIIKNFIEKRKSSGEKYSFQEFAKRINIQKTYLSKVFSRQADLSSDQIYLATLEMNLIGDAKDLFLLSWEYERTGLEQRRKELSESIEKLQLNIQIDQQKTDKHLDLKPSVLSEDELRLYYLNPLNQIIHIALGLKRFQKKVNELEKHLKISTEQLNSSLNVLEQLALISRGDKIILLKRKLHLSRKSELFWPWKTQLSLMALQHCRSITDNEHSYNFSVVFSADEETRKNIMAQYFDFLKKIEQMVQDCPEPENVYQLNFDLFPWV